MTIDPVTLAIVLIASGIGLIVGGACNALARRPETRRLAIGAGIGLALGVSGMASFSAAMYLALIVLFAAAGYGVIRHSRVRLLAANAWAACRSRTAQWLALGLVGCSLIAAGAQQIEQSIADVELQDLSHIDDMMAMPPIDPAPSYFATTDCGSPVPLRHASDLRDPQQLREVEEQILTAQKLNAFVIRKKPAADICNCHGWVFTGGQYWVHFDDVASILCENGYAPIERPAPGDLVIYRTNDDTICHSAVVRAICDDGSVLVEGKWGWMGVFLHRVGESCYGQNFTFYRSLRWGHLLTGLNPSPSASDHVSIRAD